ncbi:tRNA glutamyl-Q(34) synthetase GluQRS [Methylobacter sp.]|uniref:tRNA glutamyl-Q(34) synthetase GluQRS n=1 Tax=Methylobacter sp. TaxID=2051955 RepID=UPI003459412C
MGRFAPSPTGPLHLGSLYTALAGFLQARSQQGLWLLRIDDLDTPRNVKGSADILLKTLEAFGLHWDGEVYYQSRHLDVYNDVINDLQKNQLIYPCTCSRKTLTASDRGQSQPDIYPGICRDRQTLPDGPHALRIKTDNRIITFQDELQGLISHNLATQDGDFIVKRKDRIIAYQFAVVIDDDLQHVNHIVRGFDLLDATPKQIYLQQLLGLVTPRYMHVPVIVDQQGYKLSKQTQAMAVDLTSPDRVIFELLVLLKQNPPVELQEAPVTELLGWAVEHWNPVLLKNAHAVSCDY